MSTTIDNKVVEMRFDNKQFESNVATTMNSVEKLKKSLSFKDTSKELENFSYTVGLSIKDIKNKMWSLIEYDIAGKLKNKFMEVTKALTVQPVSAGFNEYELKMGSIQTIMASTGEDLETVNQYLGELNEYSDKTIYSFQDMTSNIGKFTNAGVNLKDSVAAIKGVANVAAVSGANANEASRAMYNFAQALSSGYVKLIDWKSIENANMATVEFKNQLLETAVAEGKLTKTSDGMYKTLKGTTISATKQFNDSLQEQWMTSEVLTKTLAKYSDTTTEIGKKAEQMATEVKTLGQLYDTLKESAQSGWAQTWEIIVGDFEEAKKFLSELNDLIGGLIGKSSEARNALLENWKALGGRDELLESFRAIVKAITSIVNPIKEAFGEVFSPLTSEGLYEFTKGLRGFFEGLILTDNASENLRRTFKGLFSLVSIVGEVFKGLGDALHIIFGGATEAGGGLLEVLAIIGDMITAIAEFIKETKIIRNTFVVFGKAVKFVLSLVGKLLGGFSDAFESGPLETFMGLFENFAYMFNEVANSSEEFGSSFKQAIKGLGDTLKNSTFFTILTSLWKGIKTVVTGILGAVSGIFRSIGEAFAAGDFRVAFDVINGLLEGGVLVGFMMIVKKIINLLKEPEGFLDTIKGVFESITEYISSFTQSIKAQALKTIATAILILTASLIALTFVDQDKLEDALAAITIAFSELLLIFTLMSKIGSSGVASNIKSTIGSAVNVISMMVALLLMSIVIKQIGSLDWATWGKGLLGIVICLGALVGVQIALSHLYKENSKAHKGTNAVIKMALALLILCIPLEKLGDMDWDEWARAIGGVTALIGAMAILSAVLGIFGSNGSGMRKGATSLVIMAAAIYLLIPPIQTLGAMWESDLKQGMIALGALMGGLIVVSIALRALASGASKMISGAAAIVIVAGAVNLMIQPLKTLGGMDTDKLKQGLLSLGALLLGFTVVMKTMGKLSAGAGKMLAGVVSITILAGVIGLLIPQIKTLGSLPTDQVLQGILSIEAILLGFSTIMALMSRLSGSAVSALSSAVSIAIIVASLRSVVASIEILGNLQADKLKQGVISLGGMFLALATVVTIMSKISSGGSLLAAASSIAVMVLAINLLVPALLVLSLIPTLLLVKSLGAIAVALVIFAAAGTYLAPLGTMLLTVAAAFVVFGVAAIAMGGGLMLIGNGLSLVAAGLIAFVGALGVSAGALGLFLIGVIKLIDDLVVAILEAIIHAGPPLAEALSVIIIGLCDVIIDCVPKIVDTFIIVITKLVQSLAEYVPQIVASLIDLFTGIVQALVDKIPELLKTIKMDPASIRGMFEMTAMLAAIMGALAAFKYLGKAAMQGVIYMGIVLAELSLVLAAIGALSKMVPDMQDLINEGGNFLQSIGTAIGKFIGGIVGGFSAGVSASLPEIGNSLTKFMSNVQGFIDGVKQVDDSVLSGTGTLVGVVLALTAANVIESLTSWLTGGSSIADFGDELVAFAPKIKEYADIVSGIDGASVEASANAAKCLSELASNLPNSGGWAGKIFGENDMSAFGDQLIPFGEGLVGYSQVVEGINAEAITNSVSAAKGLVELADLVPNTGGLVSFLTGDNRMDDFGNQLVDFAKGIKGFATEVAGITDDGSIAAAITAAKALVDLSNNIPNEGGIVAWFTGENSMASFAGQLVTLGLGLRGFAISIIGMDSNAVAEAANAGKALAEMTTHIPNEGGVAAWFTGENSITAFADSLPKLGQGLSGFATATAGITPETVTAAAQAAKVLAEMTSYIPNEGGVAAWFSGESSISKFGGDLIALGQGIKGFANNTAGITSESVTIAANACKTLAEMTSYIPNEGGVKALFSGEQSLSKFTGELSSLGQGIKGFADATAGITSDSVIAAAEACKHIAEMTKHIPTEGGIKAWFSGEQSLSKFSSEIPELGKGLAGFSKSVTDINAEKITAAANAAKSLAEMTTHIPSEGGIKAWFSGDTSIANFADKLPKLGKALAGFSKEVAGINPENVTAGANAAKSLAQMAETAPQDSSKIITFGDNLKSFGGKLKEYFNSTKDITAESISSASKALDQVKEISTVNSGNIKSLASAIKDLAKAIKNMATDIKTDLKKAGKEAIEAFISGIDGKLSAVKTACKGILNGCVEAISGKASSFESAGKDVVTGFCNGITQNTYRAEAKAAAMAKAAYDAAKAELDINSPSKVFREIGSSVPEGFAEGISKFGNLVEGSTTEMANNAIDGVKDSIHKLSNVINSDIDAQPTIRPVLDLTDVQNGVGAISGMFGSNTLGVSANIGAISAAMSRHNQNGTNDDVISAIDALGRHIDKIEKPSYNINGVNFDDDTAVVEAFETIIGAARRARRT